MTPGRRWAAVLIAALGLTASGCGAYYVHDEGCRPFEYPYYHRHVHGPGCGHYYRAGFWYYDVGCCHPCDW